MKYRIFLLGIALSLTFISACEKQDPTQDSTPPEESVQPMPAAVEVVEEEEQDLTDAELGVAPELEPDIQELQPETELAEPNPHADHTRMMIPNDKTLQSREAHLNAQEHLVSGLMAQLQALLNVSDQGVPITKLKDGQKAMTDKEIENIKTKALEARYFQIRKLISGLGHLKAKRAAFLLAQAYNKKGVPIEIRLSAAGALIKMASPSAEHVIKKGFFRIRQFIMSTYQDGSSELVYTMMGSSDSATHALFEAVLSKMIGSQPDCAAALED